jgi:hypothetical protein
MSEKEPGRFAFDLWWEQAGPLNFEQWPDRWAAIESAIRADDAAKVRAATIEECAKVAESLIVEPTATRDVTAICQELAAAELGANIANAIRALSREG